MLMNSDLNDERAVARRRLREVLTGALYLMLLTLLVGIMLDGVGIGRLIYPPTPVRCGDKPLDALVTAIESRDVAAVRRMLRGSRVDVNGVDHLTVTPIYYTILGPGATVPALLDALIEAGADVNGPRGTAVPPLVSAVSNGRPDLVERLLRAGADPRRSNRSGWTPLHHAAIRDDAASAAHLLAAGADPNAMDGEGQTPLAVARENGAHATARLLEASTRLAARSVAAHR